MQVKSLHKQHDVDYAESGDAWGPLLLEAIDLRGKNKLLGQTMAAVSAAYDTIFGRLRTRVVAIVLPFTVGDGQETDKQLAKVGRLSPGDFERLAALRHAGDESADAFDLLLMTLLIEKESYEAAKFVRRAQAHDVARTLLGQTVTATAALEDKLGEVLFPAGGHVVAVLAALGLDERVRANVTAPAAHGGDLVVAATAAFEPPAIDFDVLARAVATVLEPLLASKYAEINVCGQATRRLDVERILFTALVSNAPELSIEAAEVLNDHEVVADVAAVHAIECPQKQHVSVLQQIGMGNHAIMPAVWHAGMADIALCQEFNGGQGLLRVRPPSETRGEQMRDHVTELAMSLLERRKGGQKTADLLSDLVPDVVARATKPRETRTPLPKLANSINDALTQKTKQRRAGLPLPAYVNLALSEAEALIQAAIEAGTASPTASRDMLAAIVAQGGLRPWLDSQGVDWQNDDE